MCLKWLILKTFIFHHTLSVSHSLIFSLFFLKIILILLFVRWTWCAALLSETQKAITEVFPLSPRTWTQSEPLRWPWHCIRYECYRASCVHPVMFDYNKIFVITESQLFFCSGLITLNLINFTKKVNSFTLSFCSSFRFSLPSTNITA